MARFAGFAFITVVLYKSLLHSNPGNLPAKKSLPVRHLFENGHNLSVNYPERIGSLISHGNGLGRQQGEKRRKRAPGGCARQPMAASGHSFGPRRLDCSRSPWPERLRTDIDRVRVRRHPAEVGAVLRWDLDGL